MYIHQRPNKKEKHDCAVSDRLKILGVIIRPYRTRYMGAFVFSPNNACFSQKHIKILTLSPLVVQPRHA